MMVDGHDSGVVGEHVRYQYARDEGWTSDDVYKKCSWMVVR